MEGDLCAGSVGVQPTLVIAVTIRGGPSMKFSMAVALMSPTWAAVVRTGVMESEEVKNNKQRMEARLKELNKLRDQEKKRERRERQDKERLLGQQNKADLARMVRVI